HRAGGGGERDRGRLRPHQVTTTFGGSTWTVTLLDTSTMTGRLSLPGFVRSSPAARGSTRGTMVSLEMEATSSAVPVTTTLTVVGRVTAWGRPMTSTLSREKVLVTSWRAMSTEAFTCSTS